MVIVFNILVIIAALFLIKMFLDHTGVTWFLKGKFQGIDKRKALEYINLIENAARSLQAQYEAHGGGKPYARIHEFTMAQLNGVLNDRNFQAVVKNTPDVVECLKRMTEMITKFNQGLVTDEDKMPQMIRRYKDVTERLLGFCKEMYEDYKIYV